MLCMLLDISPSDLDLRVLDPRMRDLLVILVSVFWVDNLEAEKFS